MKINRKILLLVLAVLLVVVVFIMLTKKSASDDGRNGAVVNETDLADARPQSYAARQMPTVKADDKIFGSAQAPLKIFVYEDYTNIYSAILADTLDKIKAEAGDRLALIVRPYFPDSPLARQAAAAVDCAAEQGKWVAMRALLFARTKNNQSFDADFSYAKQINLDENNFLACLTKAEKSGKIEQSLREAGNYAVTGAPTMLIGDEMILGARPYADFVDSNGDKIEGLKAVVTRKLP